MMKFVNRMPALLFSEFNLLTAMINLLILPINEQIESANDVIYFNYIKYTANE